MKGYMAKLKAIILKNKVLFIVLGLLVLVFIPIFINNLYNHPAADDYSNYNVISGLLDGKDFNLLNLLSAGARHTVDVYLGWQGNFFSIFMGTFNPLFVSIGAYSVLMFVFQLLYIGSVLFFFGTLSRIRNFISLKQSIVLGSIYLILSLTFMYSVSEGLYWYSGVLLYFVPFSLSMILLGLIMLYVLNKNKFLFVAILLLAMCLAGANYITGLFLGSVFLALTVYSFFKKKTLFWPLLVVLVVFSACFAMNVFAPGNFIRITNFTPISVQGAMLITLPLSFDMLSHAIFGTFILPVLVLLSPSFVKVVQKVKFKFKFPFLLPICLAFIFVVFFAPCAYSYGSFYQELRVQNIQFFYLTLFIMAIYFNSLGYIVQNKRIGIFGFKHFNGICILVGSVFLILSMAITGVSNFNSKVVADDIIYKRSKIFSDCMTKAEAALMDPTKQEVTIRNCVPIKSLHYVEISNGLWIVKDMENYYNKRIIIED